MTADTGGIYAHRGSVQYATRAYIGATAYIDIEPPQGSHLETRLALRTDEAPIDTKVLTQILLCVFRHVMSSTRILSEGADEERECTNLPGLPFLLHLWGSL